MFWFRYVWCVFGVDVVIKRKKPDCNLFSWDTSLRWAPVFSYHCSQSQPSVHSEFSQPTPARINQSASYVHIANTLWQSTMRKTLEWAIRKCSRTIDRAVMFSFMPRRYHSANGRLSSHPQGDAFVSQMAHSVFTFLSVLCCSQVP